jgi:cytosine deaminase
MANLYANIAQLGSADALEAVFGMITRQPAALLGKRPYGLEAGAPADIVVLDAVSEAEAVSRIAPAMAGWKDGRQTFLRPAARLHFKDGAHVSAG